MAEGECLRDQTFVWTTQINEWMLKEETKEFTRKYIIYASFLMDFTTISGLIVYYLRCNTLRPLIAFFYFQFLRNLIQNFCFGMGAPKGYAWFNPGVPALSVPYHDTYDFFYSGHIGSCFIYFTEFYLHKQTFLIYVALFTFINEWVLMVLLRSHYFIDMLTGVIVAHVCIIWAEPATFLPDVKGLGIKGFDRKQHFYTPCQKCGWSNLDPANQISKTEHTYLMKTHRIRNQMNKPAVSSEV